MGEEKEREKSEVQIIIILGIREIKGEARGQKEIHLNFFFYVL